MTEPATSDTNTRRFAWLLGVIIVALALPPILQALAIDLAGLRVGFAGVMLASLYALRAGRTVLVAALVLAGSAALADVLSATSGSRSLSLAGLGMGVAFLVLIVASMGWYLLSTKRVTTDIVLGGVCVYMLLGLLWVSLFNLVEVAHPGSLLLNGHPLGEVTQGHEPHRFVEIIYFSFVTLTTLGYGDVTPATSAARMLAVAEAAVGQLYVAVFVARLVGLHLVHGDAGSSGP